MQLRRGRPARNSSTPGSTRSKRNNVLHRAKPQGSANLKRSTNTSKRLRPLKIPTGVSGRTVGKVTPGRIAGGPEVKSCGRVVLCQQCQRVGEQKPQNCEPMMSGLSSVLRWTKHLVAKRKGRSQCRSASHNSLDFDDRDGVRPESLDIFSVYRTVNCESCDFNRTTHAKPVTDVNANETEKFVSFWTKPEGRELKTIWEVLPDSEGHYDTHRPKSKFGDSQQQALLDLSNLNYKSLSDPALLKATISQREVTPYATPSKRKGKKPPKAEDGESRPQAEDSCIVQEKVSQCGPHNAPLLPPRLPAIPVISKKLLQNEKCNRTKFTLADQTESKQDGKAVWRDLKCSPSEPVYKRSVAILKTSNELYSSVHMNNSPPRLPPRNKPTGRDNTVISVSQMDSREDTHIYESPFKYQSPKRKGSSKSEKEKKMKRFSLKEPERRKWAAESEIYSSIQNLALPSRTHHASLDGHISSRSDSKPSVLSDVPPPLPLRNRLSAIVREPAMRSREVEVKLLKTFNLDSFMKNKWISGVAFTKKNELIVVDLREAYLLDEDGNLKKSVGTRGSNKLREPIDVCVMANGNFVISDHAAQDVKMYNWKGQYLRCVAGDPSCWANIAGVATTANREVIIAGTEKMRLTVHSEDNRLLYTIPDAGCKSPFDHPYSVAVNHLTGDIIVGDDNRQMVAAVAPDGRVLWRFNGCSGDRHFFPSSICVDNDGYIFVADLYNEKVFMLDTSGKFLKTLLSRGQGLKGGPVAIAVDGRGHLVVADEERTLKVFKYGENGFALYRRHCACPANFS